MEMICSFYLKVLPHLIYLAALVFLFNRQDESKHQLLTLCLYRTPPSSDVLDSDLGPSSHPPVPYSLPFPKSSQDKILFKSRHVGHRELSH